MALRKWVLIQLLATLLLAFNAAAAAAETTLERIKSSGQINLGYRADQTPLSFDKGSGTPAGYSVELCQLIAAAVRDNVGRSLKVNYVPVTAESRFDAIQKGEIDILCGATTKTLSRAEIVSFTQPTFVTGGSLLSHNDAAVIKFNNLAGKKVAVVSNTTTIDALNEALERSNISAEVIPVATTSAGMDMLEKRQVHAFAADQVVLIGQVIARGGRQRFSLSDDLFSFEPFALAVQRGDADFQLVADRVLSELYRGRQILQIYGKWFGAYGKQLPTALEAMYQLNATPR